MPSYRPGRKKPWAARAKRGIVHYFLGYYTTREEALTAEVNFALTYPRQCRKKILL